MEYTRNNRFFICIVVSMLLILKTGNACQMEQLAAEIHTIGRIQCRHNIPSDLINVVRWTKSTSDDCYVNGAPYLVAWDGDRKINDQDYGIDTDFSLIIPDVTTAVIGIYRCTVVPKDATRISDNDTRLTVYKYPSDPPSITYEILGGNQIEINCSHGPVFPLFYPNFPFPHHNNRTIRNQDWTYMVSIKAVQQFSGSKITLYCSHSYLDQQQLQQHRSSFLDVYRSNNNQDDYTTDPPESTPTLKSNSIHTENTPEQEHSGNPSLAGAQFVAIMVPVLLLQIFIVLLLLSVQVRQLKIRHHGSVGDEQEKEYGQKMCHLALMEKDPLTTDLAVDTDKDDSGKLFAMIKQAVQEMNSNQHMDPSGKGEATCITL